MSKAVSKKINIFEKTIEFDHEYEFEGNKISSCKLRKPRLMDRIMNSKSAEFHGFNRDETEVQLISRLTKLPVEFLHSLWLDDYLKIDEAFANFFVSKKKKSTQ